MKPLCPSTRTEGSDRPPGCSLTRNLNQPDEGDALMAVDGPPGCGKSTILAKVASLLGKSAVIQVTHDLTPSSREQTLEVGWLVDRSFYFSMRSTV